MRVATKERDPSTLTDKELFAEIRSFPDNMIWVAKCITEAEKRGHDMAKHRTGVGAYYSLVENGRLLPEIVLRYAFDRGLMHNLSRLSLDTQRQILADECLPVSWSEKPQPVSLMSTEQVKTVFDLDKGTIIPRNKQTPAIKPPSGIPKKKTSPNQYIAIAVPRSKVQALMRKADLSGNRDEFLTKALLRGAEIQ